MHTLLCLEGNVLQTALVNGDEEEKLILLSRWEASLVPAIEFLKSLGGGRSMVFHRDGEFSPQYE